MTRKKVKLVWIVNDSARKASFKKRRLGFLKKVSELSTLCGVNAFAIVYSPDVTEPTFWPSRTAVQRLLTTYQRLPDMERYKKMTNQRSYLKQRVAKTQEQLKKQQKRSKKLEMAYLMYQINRGKSTDKLTATELQGLIWILYMRMKEIRERLSYLQRVPFPSQAWQQPPTPPAPATENTHVPLKGPTRETPMWDQWFIDMMMNNNGNINGSGSTIRSDIAALANYPYPDSSVELGALWHYACDGSFIAANDRTVYAHNDVRPLGNMNNMSSVRCSAGGGNNTGLGWGLQPLAMEPLPFGVFGGHGSGTETEMELPYDVTKPWPNNRMNAKTNIGTHLVT